MHLVRQYPDQHQDVLARKKTLENFIKFPESRGYHLELNLVKWGENEPKYDLRRWNEDRSRMTKGATLSKEELLILRDELSKITF